MIKYIVLLAIPALLISCGSPKTEQVSTETPQDTTSMPDGDFAPAEPSPSSESSESSEPGPEEVVEFSGITNNFPNFSLEVLSTDSLEIEVNNAFGKLLNIYDTLEYSKVTSTYTWERPYYARGQEGESTLASESQEETKTWYFDRNYQLKGFSREFTWGPDFPRSESTLYLFSGDSLKAISERSVDESEVTVIDQLRILSSNCPRCGTSISFQISPAEPRAYPGEEKFKTIKEIFDSEFLELTTLIKSERKNAKTEDSDLVFNVKRTKEGNEEQKSKAIKYVIRFSVNKELYSNYFNNNP